MMRKIIPVLICLFVATATTAVAQKRRTKKIVEPSTPVRTLPNISLSDAILQYRFDEAEELLQAQIESETEAGKNTASSEAKLQTIQKAKSQLNVVEQVVFIDSLVVPFEQLFGHIGCSEECGEILSYQNYFKPDTDNRQESSVFISQMKDKLFYAEKNNKGQYQLYSRSKEGNKWASPEPLAWLETNDDTHQNYPFMMSDGITLYYAAQGPESIGGYDIFMTRYDADEHSFLTPENIGMPFNSPANDYMYIVDDYMNLGWFVTERNQTEGNVCIYTFIPNETRKIYNTSQLSSEKLRSLAKIMRISDTWTNSQEVEDAKARLASLSNGKTTNDVQKDGSLFILNDKIVYHQASDFHSTDARMQYEYWLEGQQQVKQLEQQLEKLRTQYSKESSAKRESLGNSIIKIENDLRTLYENLHRQMKDIRKLEANTIN